MTRVLTTEPKAWTDALSVREILNVQSGYARGRVRLGSGVIPEGASGRQIGGGGEEVPGPWAYTFPLPLVIDNHGGTAGESARLKALGLELDVEIGDLFLIDGVEYELTDDKPWSAYPSLEKV